FLSIATAPAQHSPFRLVHPQSLRQLPSPKPQRRLLQSPPHSARQLYGNRKHILLPFSANKCFESAHPEPVRAFCSQDEIRHKAFAACLALNKAPTLLHTQAAPAANRPQEMHSLYSHLKSRDFGWQLPQSKRPRASASGTRVQRFRASANRYTCK